MTGEKLSMVKVWCHKFQTTCWANPRQGKKYIGEFRCTKCGETGHSKA